MKELTFSFDTCLRFTQPVQKHTFTLRCLPAEGPRQRLTECRFSLAPHTAVWQGRDGFGNRLAAGSIYAPHIGFEYHVHGRAVVDLSRPDHSGLHPAYGYPGALTAPSRALREFFAAAHTDGLPPAETALRLSRAVHDHFVYTPGSTTVATTAAQAFAQGRGVCQDYAQCLLVLCRLAGLRCRYVSGLPAGEGATHAWAEVYLPERGWLGFDPTRGCMAGEHYLTLAVGRDYADCPIERGTLFGAGQQSQSVYMCVQEG